MDYSVYKTSKQIVAKPILCVVMMPIFIYFVLVDTTSEVFNLRKRNFSLLIHRIHFDVHC
jgi:hypothetical protein